MKSITKIAHFNLHLQWNGILSHDIPALFAMALGLIPIILVVIWILPVIFRKDRKTYYDAVAGTGIIMDKPTK